MHITLSPMRSDETLTLSRYGDTLDLNGEVYDFSGLPDGATLPRDAVSCRWLASDVQRIGGALHLMLILPHGADAPDETRFPPALELTDDGPVSLPPYAPPPSSIPPEEVGI